MPNVVSVFIFSVLAVGFLAAGALRSFTTVIKLETT